MFEEIININLGKVKGLTPKLRLEGKVIQIKYDNEVEWRDLAEIPDNIKAVQTYSDLPADANDGDVCLVLEDGYGEDGWRQVSINDILVGRIPSQISFADTLEEMRANCTLDRDNLVSGVFSYETQLKNSDKYINVMFIQGKAEGQEFVGIIMFDEATSSEDSRVGYVITDNPEVLSMLMLEGEGNIPATPNVWNKLEMSYVPTEDGEDYEMFIKTMELDKAPVIGGHITLEADLYYDIEKSPLYGYSEFHYSIPEIKKTEVFTSLLLGNFAERTSKGLYSFNEGIWTAIYPEEKMKEFHYDDYVDEKSRESGDYWKEYLPPGEEGEIAKIYHKVSYRNEAYEPKMSVYANLNGTVRVGNSEDWASAADWVAQGYYLPNNIPQDLLDRLNNKTIVIGGSLGNDWCDGYIAFADNSAIVIGDYSDRGFIYTSTDNKVFTFDVFAEMDDNLDTSISFFLKEKGWYCFEEGLIVRCESYHLPIADMMSRDYFTSNVRSVFLLDGLTTQVPSELASNWFDLSGLFFGCNPVFYSDSGLHVFTWDYEYGSFIRYSSLEKTWLEHDPVSDSKKLKQAHTHDNKPILDSIQYSTQLIPSIDYDKARITDTPYEFNRLYNYHGTGLIFKTPKDTGAFKSAYCYSGFPNNEITVNRMGAATPFYTIYNDKIYYDWYLHDGVLEDYDKDDIPNIKLIDSFGGDTFKRRWLYAARKCMKNITDFRGGYYGNGEPYMYNRGAFGHWYGSTLPYFSTENAVNCDCMFALSRVRALPFVSDIDISGNSNYGNSANILQTYSPLNFSKCESMKYCFYDCTSLIAIGTLFFGYPEYTTEGYKYNGVSMPTSKMIKAFYNCTSLEYLVIIGRIKVDSNDLSFIDSPNLRNDCVQTILEALESNVGEETQYTVYFHENVYNALTDSQKAIATNKNILLSYTKL